MKSLIALLLSLCFYQSASAQGWVSSGGELFQTSKNPWFVKSVSVVKYCVAIDSTSFSASPATVATAIREGIDYWKTEFDSSTSLTGSHTFQVATQDFQQVDCGSEPDIRFLFGYGTLKDKEIEYLKNPSKYIGITVRTDYDLVMMKGRGFIYFSSDSGDHAYENKGSLIPKAWEHPKILKYAILHELGHVFGIPHMGSGLMSEVFLNQILNKSLVSKYEQTAIESFLRPNGLIESCSLSSAALTWFGAPAGTQCLAVQTANQMGPWKVFAKKNKDANLDEIGEVRNLQINLADQRGKPVTVLELTEGQKVFTPVETAFRSFIFGPFQIDMGLSAIYVPAVSKRPTPVYVSITPSSLSIQATVLPNRLEPVFIFNSPLSVLLLMSPTH